MIVVIIIIIIMVINVECDFSTADALYVIICLRFNYTKKVDCLNFDILTLLIHVVFKSANTSSICA